MRSVRFPFLRRPVRPGRVAAAALATATLTTVLTAFGVGGSAPDGDRAGEGTERPAVPRFAGSDRLSGPALNRFVKRVVAEMPLEHKVGQLFTTFVHGTDADTPDPRNTELYGVATPAEVVEKYHLGGVIYFTWSDNVADGPQQIARLSNGLQRAAVDSGSQVPLLVSTDQEYGQVTRIGPPATQLPGSMALGAADDKDLARKAAALGGEELRAMGINQDFAPVADVNVNPANPVIGVRSFSSDPAAVSALTAAQVKGYQDDAGIAAAAKHFPGHGDTEVDSHTGVPVITHTREEWERIDAPPFRAAVEAGVDMVMTGHLVMPELDPSETPATLSQPILTGLLREELGFDGVVITDALEMAGVRERYGDDRIPVMALQAGADVLLMPKDLDVAYQAVLDAVDSGELTEERIDASVTRILTLKAENGVLADPFVDEKAVSDHVGTADHLRQAQEIADRTTTLVKNDDGALPFADAPATMLVAGAARAETEALVAAAEQRGTRATALVTGTKPTDEEIADALARAAEHEVTVVLTQRATHPATDPDGRQAELVRRLLEDGRRVVVAAVRDAYDIAAFPEVPAYLATYSTTDVAMEALAGVLYGERAPSGALPVSVPTADGQGELYPLGHGLTW